ncbi:hypothetical protein Cni_G27509 [Canna indica]|uniref:J domain-containing protein n=1 Tax=Canna indica TaxID=4628 RepID=A0AAQ3L3Y2_9LILI|nr:hypothetical protein Cni_G27509 [Canna indica]
MPYIDDQSLDVSTSHLLLVVYELADMDIGDRDGMGDGMAEGEKRLAIAVRLLKVRDLGQAVRRVGHGGGSLLDGVDEVIATANVLLAGQRQINNHVDWYWVLQLLPQFPTNPTDPITVKRQYCRLALLVNPDRTSVFGTNSTYRQAMPMPSSQIPQKVPFSTPSCTSPTLQSA